MTTRIKIIAGLIVLILLFSMSSVIYLQSNRISDLETQVDDAIQIANDSGRQATKYRNKYNILVSHNKVLMIERESVQKLFKSEEFAWTLKYEGLQKNLKNLVQTTKAVAKIDTTLKIEPKETRGIVFRSSAEIKADTTEQILWDDQYNRVSIKGDGLNLKIDVPIQGVIFWERPHKFWFIKWGKKIYTSEFSTLNPLAQVTNHEVIQVRQK
jgi:hypothetical protein